VKLLPWSVDKENELPLEAFRQYEGRNGTAPVRIGAADPDFLLPTITALTVSHPLTELPLDPPNLPLPLLQLLSLNLQ
jgi:hypothetical protein